MHVICTVICEQNTSIMEKKRNGLVAAFDKFSTKVTKLTGTPGAFIVALVTIVVWGATGPIFNYSDTWQLVINTGTTIITFLMVFLIQQTQNKDTLALQIKLNELIAANKNASNRLIDSEDLTAEELEVLKNYYIKMSEKAKQEVTLRKSHSIEEEKGNSKTNVPNKNGNTGKAKKA